MAFTCSQNQLYAHEHNNHHHHHRYHRVLNVSGLWFVVYGLWFGLLFYPTIYLRHHSLRKRAHHVRPRLQMQGGGAALAAKGRL